MRPCPQPLTTLPRQLSLLPVLTEPGRLTPAERREAVALLAALLTEAASPPAPDAFDDGG